MERLRDVPRTTYAHWVCSYKMFDVYRKCLVAIACLTRASAIIFICSIRWVIAFRRVARYIRRNSSCKLFTCTRSAILFISWKYSLISYLLMAWLVCLFGLVSCLASFFTALGLLELLLVTSFFSALGLPELLLIASFFTALGLLEHFLVASFFTALGLLELLLVASFFTALGLLEHLLFASFFTALGLLNFYLSLHSLLH